MSRKRKKLSVCDTLAAILVNLWATEKKQVPASWNFFNHTELDDLLHSVRNEFIRNGSYALVAHDWVSKLAAWIGDRRCLEVGAGRGMLAKALKNCGVDVRATDSRSWKFLCDFDGGMWTPVEKKTALQAVKNYGKDTDILILCWPPGRNAKKQEREMATRAAAAFKKKNPNGLIVYIGELRDGCTADDTFFDAVQFIDTDRKFNAASRLFCNWYSIWDGLYLARVM